MITLGGKYRRLDKLTRMMTRANDAYRATGREDRAKRARIARVQLRLSNARATEVTRLHATGISLAVIGAHLDDTDPYRHGVPDNRPVRQARGSR
jgi:hypothetical protein